MARGLLSQAAAETDIDDSAEVLEEQYMRMYPKIGRDFVHQEDLAEILIGIIRLLKPELLPLISVRSDGEARKRAEEYKNLLDSNKLGNNIYKDLIDLDD